ncbi:MAG: hypothetical protein AAGA91_13885 [Pseudomonadota bacterium]
MSSISADSLTAASHEPRAALRRLQMMVADGSIELHVILSPPRTLSTVLGKLFAEASDFGCWSNEPTSKFGNEDRRVDASYRSILDAVERARPSADGVRRVLLSLIASTVGPEQEIKDLLSIVHTVSFSIRNPILAIESFMLLIADILSEIGVVPTSPKQMIAEGWVPPGAELDYLNKVGAGVWRDHMAHLRRLRDYRCLTDRQHYVANSIASTAAFRRELWLDPAYVALVHTGDLSLLHQRQAADPAYQARMEQCLSLDPDQLKTRAPDFHEIVAQTGASWLQTWRLLVATRTHAPDKLRAVVDATQFQLRPERLIPLLQQRLGVLAREAAMGPLQSTDGYLEQYAETELKAGTMFGRAYASSDVDRPAKAPLELWRLPDFVQRHLPLYMWVFLALSMDQDLGLPAFTSLSDLLESPCPDGDGGEQPLAALDPVYAYLQAVAASASGADEGAGYMRALSARHAAHRSTFDLIDSVAAHLQSSASS